MVFSHLFGPSAAAKASLAEGQTGVLEAVKALSAGDFETAMALCDEKSPTDASHFLTGVGRLVPAAVGRAIPDSAREHIITPAIYSGLARQARGGGLGASVTRKMAEHMFTWTEAAEQSLLDRRARDVARSADAALRIEVALLNDMGRSTASSALYSALEDYAQCGENNVFVILAELLYVSPKWYGSEEEVERLGEAALTSPATPAWFGLWARAQIELWLFRVHMAEDQDAMVGASIYYRDDEGYARTLEQVDDRFWKAAAGAPMTFAERVFVHNHMAFLTSRRGMTDRAARHVEAMGEVMSILPWAYTFVSDDRRAELKRLRRSVGLPAV